MIKKTEHDLLLKKKKLLCVIVVSVKRLASFELYIDVNPDIQIKGTISEHARTLTNVTAFKKKGLQPSRKSVLTNLVAPVGPVGKMSLEPLTIKIISQLATLDVSKLNHPVNIDCLKDKSLPSNLVSGYWTQAAAW